MVILDLPCLKRSNVTSVFLAFKIVKSAQQNIVPFPFREVIQVALTVV